MKVQLLTVFAGVWGASAFQLPTPATSKASTSALSANYVNSISQDRYGTSGRRGRYSDRYDRRADSYDRRGGIGSQSSGYGAYGGGRQRYGYDYEMRSDENLRDEQSRNYGTYYADRGIGTRGGYGVRSSSGRRGGYGDRFYAPVNERDARVMSRSYGSRAYDSRTPDFRYEPEDMRMDYLFAGLDPPVLVQGGSLRTWSFENDEIERVQILMNTDGRPMNAEIALWEGPDNTPQKIKCYVEDGCQRPFRAIMETPRGQNAIAVRNTNGLEFPLAACVSEVWDGGSNGLPSRSERIFDAPPETVQGGATRTFPIPEDVASLKVLIQTDGRPLNARIELLQGPNNNKSVMEVYAEDGVLRPFFAMLDTPGTNNVVRVVNTSPVEYPMYVGIEAHMYGLDSDFRGGSSYSRGGRGRTNGRFYNQY